MRIFRVRALGAFALALVVSACGTGGSTTPTVAPTAVPKPAAPPTVAPAAAPSTVPVASVAPLPAASAAVVAASPSAAVASGAKPTVKVGSFAFPESVILGELYGQMLENNGYTVARHLNIGARDIVEPALEKGDIDLVAEYLATILTFVSKPAPTKASSDPAATAKALQDALAPKGLTALQYSSAVDANGFVVTKATADKYHLAKLSDLAPVAAQLIMGGPPECPPNPFCLDGLQKTYGLKFKEFKSLDTGGPLTVQALIGNQVDVAELFTTDPAIVKNNFVLLQDDKTLQLADNIVPIVRNDVLSKAPDMKALLDRVSTALTTSDLTNLITEVTDQHKDAKDVAAAYLKSKNLTK